MSESGKFAYHRAADDGILRVGKKDDCFDVGSNLPVDVGNPALIFEIGIVAYAAKDELGTFLATKVGCQAFVGADLNLRHILDSETDGGQTFIKRLKAMLVGIDADSDNYFIEKRDSSLQKSQMADGHRVERPRENSYAIHCYLRFLCFLECDLLGMCLVLCPSSPNT